MLEKMGWKRGEGLGKDGTGMKDPVRHHFIQRLYSEYIILISNKIICLSCLLFSTD